MNSFATEAIHFGYEKDKQMSMAVPIYQTTAYEYESTMQAANRFSLKELGNIYTSYLASNNIHKSSLSPTEL